MNRNGTTFVEFIEPSLSLAETGTMHKVIPLGTRVKVKPNSLGCGALWPDGVGEVIGVCGRGPIETYIVLLDVPVQTDRGMERAVAFPGTVLMGEDGASFDLGFEK